MYMNTSSILTSIKYVLRTFSLTTFSLFFWAVNCYNYQLLTGYLERFMLYILCLHLMIT